MRRLAFWLSILVPAAAVIAGVSWGTFVLGVPGEWSWERVEPTEPLWLALGPLLVAAALYLGFVWIGAQRVELIRSWELTAWIFGLVACGFAWLWIAQEAAPDNFQLSKAVWILAHRGSSGYFSEANENARDLSAYLAGYERHMAEGDVLPIGTHPPGLTVAFRALLGLCREFPAVVDATLATQPDSVRSAFSAFDSTSLRPRTLSRVERAVLWLAALLVQSGAAFAIVPLFGLLRLNCSRRASWLSAAFWPTIPALALFLPKADCLYPLPALAFLWLWLTALAHRSRLLSALAGLVFWFGLTLSLAFLPIALVALLTGCPFTARERPETLTASGSEALESISRSRFGSSWNIVPFSRSLMAAAGWATLGFAIPCLATGWLLKLNLLRVWWLNFQNHAGFYGQFPRTYWKWLLVNPIELAIAAGVPLTVLAIWSIAVRRRPAAGYDWAWLVTMGLLWLSGKNMGEAARLWILLMPFLAWSAGPLFEAQHLSKGPFGREAQPSAKVSADSFLSENAWCIALAMQLITTAAIVTQVAGFHYPITLKS